MNGGDAERRAAPASERAPVSAPVWKRIEAAVRRVVRRTVAASEREEIAQQIYLQILENIQKVRDSERIDAWATRVAVNAVWSTLRSRQRWRKLVVPSDDPDIELAFYAVDFEVRERVASVFSALEMLSPRYRRLLEERWLDDKGATHVAESERISPTTAKRRLRKAQRLLNAVIERNTHLRSKAQRSR
jgi:RNA polymerase sigma factor (sigma-70 family)